MMKILFLILLIISFWYINVASIVFIVIASLFNLWILSVYWAGKVKPKNESNWSAEEIKILNKYRVFFKYPTIASILSSTASGIYLIGAILVVWLLYNTFWIHAGILVINIIVSGNLSAKLNPIFYLHDAVERRKKNEFHEEMILVDRIYDKVYKKDKEKK